MAHRKRQGRIFQSTVCCAMLGIVASALAMSPPAVELPKPTGRFNVGTTSWRMTDESRRESFTDTQEPRQVEVLAWYPAAVGGSPVPYLRAGLTEARTFAKLVRGADTALDGLSEVRTHATADVPPIPGPKLPVLLFSHGYTAAVSSYTALLEDLASHGYAVLSIVHPYEAVAATLADDRVVTLLDAAGTMRQPIRDVIGEWAAEDETMAKVTKAAGDEERLRLLRGYLSTLKQTNVALRRWVDDMVLVLNRLNGPAKAGRDGPKARLDDHGSSGLRLLARLDLTRIGVFGHSMGGVTAGQFCLEDRRCRAGLNLDGIPQYGTMIDRRMDRPFLMVYSARPGRAGASDVIYRRAASRYYRVDVRDTLHLDFSDMIFWGGPLRDRGAFGAIAPARASEITSTIVREFFDQELLGRRSSLLSGKQVFPEVTIVTVGRGSR